jgi:hypothetical protein
VDSTVKSILMYLAINLHKTQYPTPIYVLNLLLPVTCSQTWSVLTFLASAHPGKQVKHFQVEGPLQDIVSHEVLV